MEQKAVETSKSFFKLLVFKKMPCGNSEWVMFLLKKENTGELVWKKKRNIGCGRFTKLDTLSWVIKLFQITISQKNTIFRRFKNTQFLSFYFLWKRLNHDCIFEVQNSLSSVDKHKDFEKCFCSLWKNSLNKKLCTPLKVRRIKKTSYWRSEHIQLLSLSHLPCQLCVCYAQ